ncbi:MAG: iron-sulfur cluster assembly accessory protein [Planctomycetota bacterium]
MIVVTDKAADWIQRLKKDHSAEDTAGLRITVEGGGCSGFQYKMDFGPERDGDRVFENGEARVFVDPKSLMFVDGSVLDYSDALTNGGFVVKNPQSTGECGCGMSFSV